MNNATQTHSPDPVVLKPDRGLSMPQQVLIALILGVVTGIFFAHLCHHIYETPIITMG